MYLEFFVFLTNLMALLQALKSLKILEKDRNVDVMTLAKLYAGLLCDHVTGSSNLSTRFNHPHSSRLTKYTLLLFS